VYSGRVEDEISFNFRVPWSAVRGTERVTVKLYPGQGAVLNEALQAARDGLKATQRARDLDSLVALARMALLRATCLESQGRLSATERSVLVEQAGLVYQIVLAYEHREGGYGVFPGAQPDLYRTGQALLCLVDLGHWYPVDPAAVQRAAEWLLYRQSERGIWQGAGAPYGWQSLPRAELPLTAYTAWALIEAGYADTPEVRWAIEHLERYLDKASEPYVLALVAQALVAYGEARSSSVSEAGQAALEALAAQAVVEDGVAVWSDDLQTLSGALSDDRRIDSADVERTALAVRALLRAGVHSELAFQGLGALAEGRNAQGTWDSAPAALAALRAYIAYDAAVDEAQPIDARVRVSVDGVEAEPVNLDEEPTDVPRVLVFDALSKGYNAVEIATEGEPVLYQVVGEYSLPWDQVVSGDQDEQELAIEVTADQTALDVGDATTVTVGVMLNRAAPAPVVRLELGVPPTFDVSVESVWRSASADQISHVEMLPGQVVVYLVDVTERTPIQFSYQLVARSEGLIHTLQFRAIEPGNPEREVYREPIEFDVVLPEP